MWGIIVTGLKTKTRLQTKTCKKYLLGLVLVTFGLKIIIIIMIIHCYNIIIVIHDCTVILFLNFLLNRLTNTSQVILIVKN